MWEYVEEEHSYNYELRKNKLQKIMWANEESTMSDTAIQQKSNATEEDKEQTIVHETRKIANKNLKYKWSQFIKKRQTFLIPALRRQR